MKQTIKNTSHINWNYFPITITSEYGIKLHGIIEYWSKDYSIKLVQPFNAVACSGHMQYAVPAVFSTTEVPRKGVHFINLIERAETVLISLYEEKKVILDALDIKRLLTEGYFKNDTALFDTCCKEWNVSAVDKVILEELI